MGPGITKSRYSEDRAKDELDELLDEPEPATVVNADEVRRRLNQAAGQRLMAARERAGWSRRRLAIALDCARQSLINWELAGARHPKPPWLDEMLRETAPEVARELFRSHAADLRRAS